MILTGSIIANKYQRACLCRANGNFKSKQCASITSKQVDDMTMRFAIAVALAVALSANAKEQVVLHRDLDTNALEWTAGTDFVRGDDWGATPLSSSKSSSTKGPKSSSTKGPKSSTSYNTKGPKSSKAPKGNPSPRPPTGSKTKPNDCPEPSKLQTCDPRVSGDQCALQSSCKGTCVPKYCKVPDHGPHKVHGFGESSDSNYNQYVKLGSVCGYFHYVEGQPKPRHAVEVCCVVKNDNRSPVDFLEYGKCDGCEACDAPQKVNDACCKIALGGEMGRDGDYSPHCKGGKVCCKCGAGDGRDSYACIGEYEDCTESKCYGG